ncbi:Protein N-acetyltransferase, RimJ/RimL family [Arboricoccus pini]|uniref:Protein N-acetyltransferase, RimJ/RimL family n=1 Tax=Arboricoccus pini TaxID=1963835 RepID=A0A212RY04_9PROT|nr:GNAT family protein [Arboricoccus pini]SNB77618.1 Protein N-acetyltransferase, RimJ/RimL family [Arboricoccus pini]
MELRPLVAADFAAIKTWFANEAALVQWAGPGIRYPLDAVQIDAMLAESTGQPPTRLLWVGLEGQAVSAHAQLAIDWRNGVARLARVALDPAKRGRGLAAPFLAKIRDAAFALDCIERLELNVYTFNEAAIRTYRRLGFVEEGVRRSAVKVGDARWDTAMFGLLREEWQQQS